MIGALFVALLAAGAVPPAQEIVARSDEIRNPAGSFEVDLHLTEYESGTARNELTLHVASRPDAATGQFRSLVRYRDPPRDAGKAVLLNGTTMWFYDPASKASVRISPQGRLIGTASQGDVVTVNFARDYAATLVGAEAITDADHARRDCFHLELKPIHDEAIYGRAEYWIEQGTFRPVKGKFYSDSGRLLKIAYYHQYEEQLGVARPGETIILDAVDSRLVTTVRFSGYQWKEIPDSWFQRDYLPRMN